MKKVNSTIKTMLAIITVAAAISLTSCGGNENSTASKSEIDSLRSQIKALTAGNETIAKNLATFDTLDYTVFSNQDWVRMHESHSQNVLVRWPDGHTTTGLAKHTEDMKAMFVYAPNIQIKQHPIRFGSGNLTAVTGIMTGTFTKPMPIGNGKFIQPTGKSFSLPMCTIGVWKDGSMAEENLYWDNQTFMTQLGLGK